MLKEVTISRQLNHHNIVKFIEFIDSDQYYYIVQELVVGGGSSAIVKFTYLSWDLLRHVIRQVAAGIYARGGWALFTATLSPKVFVLADRVQPLQDPVLKLRKSDDPAPSRMRGASSPRRRRRHRRRSSWPTLGC